MKEAGVDYIYKGVARGGVAERLLANNMETGSLRTLDTLLWEEWKQFDGAVVSAAMRRRTGIADLMSRGLKHPIPNGLGKMVLQTQNVGEFEPAEISMDAVTQGKRQRPDYGANFLPLPVVFSDFSYSIRTLEASRNSGEPLDTTSIEQATKVVLEKVETMLFNGASSYSFGGGKIYGYTDFPDRNTMAMALAWDASGVTGRDIVDDVIAMKQVAIGDRHYGPFMLYIPLAYETVMDKDFDPLSANTKTIRARIMEIEGIAGVKVSDFLTADNVVLVELDVATVRIVEGLPLRVVQWESSGGLMVDFKVMTIMIPQIRSDHETRSGLVHLA